ncbi:MAG: hypothetical protein R6U26_00395 [Candidatus Undinarchaeales archaeon]
MTKVELVGFREIKIEKLCFVIMIVFLLLLLTSVIAPEKITKQGYKQELYEKCAVSCGSPETCERLSNQSIWTLAMAVELCDCMNENDDLKYCCNKLNLECP